MRFYAAMCREMTYLGEIHHHERRNQMCPEPKKTTRSKSKASAAKETSQSIAEQTEAFLKAGGTITKIQTGACGQTTYNAMGRRQKS